MIESAGGMIPFLCHVFLIFFGGFFALNFVFNQNFANAKLSRIYIPSFDCSWNFSSSINH